MLIQICIRGCKVYPLGITDYSEFKNAPYVIKTEENFCPICHSRYVLSNYMDFCSARWTTVQCDTDNCKGWTKARLQQKS